MCCSRPDARRVEQSQPKPEPSPLLLVLQGVRVSKRHAEQQIVLPPTLVLMLVDAIAIGFN